MRCRLSLVAVLQLLNISLPSVDITMHMFRFRPQPLYTNITHANPQRRDNKPLHTPTHTTPTPPRPQDPAPSADQKITTGGLDNSINCRPLATRGVPRYHAPGRPTLGYRHSWQGSSVTGTNPR